MCLVMVVILYTCCYVWSYWFGLRAVTVSDICAVPTASIMCLEPAISAQNMSVLCRNIIISSYRFSNVCDAAGASNVSGRIPLRMHVSDKPYPVCCTTKLPNAAFLCAVCMLDAVYSAHT